MMSKLMDTHIQRILKEASFEELTERHSSRIIGGVDHTFAHTHTVTTHENEKTQHYGFGGFKSGLIALGSIVVGAMLVYGGYQAVKYYQRKHRHSIMDSSSSNIEEEHFNLKQAILEQSNHIQVNAKDAPLYYAGELFLDNHSVRGFIEKNPSLKESFENAHKDPYVTSSMVYYGIISGTEEEFGIKSDCKALYDVLDDYLIKCKRPEHEFAISPLLRDFDLAVVKQKKISKPLNESNLVEYWNCLLGTDVHLHINSFERPNYSI